MTRKSSTPARTLGVVAFFVAALTLLIALAALAQQSSTGQTPSTRTIVPVVPIGASVAHRWHDLAPANRPPTSAQVGHSTTSPRQSPAADSEAVIFLPPAAYDTGGNNPWGVTIADLNGDGKPDLIVTNESSIRSVGILLGNGDGTFQAGVDYDSGAGPVYTAAVADLNGDGKPDLVLASYVYVSVFLGNGDGTFQPPHLYYSGFSAYESYVVIGDLNGDGKPDLAVGHSCSGTCTTGSLDVLLGNGDGTFRAPVSYSSGGFGNYSVAVADVNGDGKPDLLVSNWCTSICDSSTPTESSVGVLLGNGDGTFQPATSYDSGGHGTLALAVADLNGDSILDLVVASCGPWACSPSGGGGNVGVLLGHGDGTFQAAVTYSAGTAPHSVGIADLNGDGNPDIVVGDWGLSQGSNDGVISVLLGNGDGTFQPVIAFSSGGKEVPSIAVADLNGDSKPDVVAASAGTLYNNPPPGIVTVLLNDTGSSRLSTTTTLTSLLNPSVFGQSATFTATVTSNSSTPTGPVQILNGSTVVGSGTLTNGSVSIPVSTLPSGTDSIIASYLGSSGFAPSKSSLLIQTVTQAATTASLASSLNPAGTNQAVTFTATVASQYGGAAKGTVTFMAGSQSLGSATLSGNVAAFTTSFATAGTYIITASYSGDSNNTGSASAALSEKIIASTTTTLTSSLNPSVIGQAVTFTAAVTSSSGTPPDGETIVFYKGSTVMGTVPLSGGSAALTTSTLSSGISTITASYSGDSNFAASTSPGVRQVVNSTTKSATATTLTSSLNPSIYGQTVIFTAAVTTSGPLPPTGRVAFTWSDYTIGSVTLNSSGIATLTKANLDANPFPLTAVYKGDTNNLGSTSPVLNQTVLQTTSHATISSSLNPAAQGQAVTFTAKVTSPTVTPTGPVTFKAGTTVLGTVQLSGGKARYTTTSLPAGSTVIRVTYKGDSDIKGSSAAVTQIVQP